MDRIRAVAVLPGQPFSAHLTHLRRPGLDEVPGGRGVLVRVIQGGVDGTDREIVQGHYGVAPPGCEFLVLGHECLGRVEAVGPAVTRVEPGDYVARRCGGPAAACTTRSAGPT